MTDSQKNLGLVLSGGGARGAYEAGVVHYIRTMLPADGGAKRRFDTLCGSSVGAINTAFLAATAHDVGHQGHALNEIWKNIRQSDIYRRDVASFLTLVSQSLTGIGRNIFTSLKRSRPENNARMHFRGILDTSPLLPFLKHTIPWKQISLNIQNRLLKAVSVTATNANTGRLELFVEKHPETPYTGHYIFNEVKLEAFHIMASSALPFVFPTVRINRQHYIDGGLRLNTPMSPAIQLGAEKILVIGMHHESEKVDAPAERELFTGSELAPTLGNLIGKVLNSIFLDKLDYDIEQMTRINRIIDWGEGCFGHDYLQQTNRYLVDNGIRGDIANRGLKRLEVMKIFPSRDIREIFGDATGHGAAFIDQLARSEKFLLKILDVDVATSRDFLSYIIFYPKYLSMLLDLGFEDARANHERLREFLTT